MAYTHMTLAGSADQSDLIWFVVDSTSGDVVEPSISNLKTGHNDGLGQPLKRQIESTSGTTKAKPEKRVRFHSTPYPPASTSSTLSTSEVAKAILSSDGMRKDFCDVIRIRLREPLQASECVGVLENSDRCRNFVYPSPNRCCSQMRQATSLGQVITSVSKRQLVGGLALYDRLRLAKILAIAVLQYHSTPWLRVSWRSEDIYFFGNELASSQDMPTLTSPHFNVKVKEPCEQLSRASTFPRHNLARSSRVVSRRTFLARE